MGGIMSKQIEPPKWVEPVIHPPDEFKLISHLNKKSEPVSRHVISKKKKISIESSENSQFPERFSKKRFGLNQVLGAINRFFKSVIGSKDYRSGFFYVEEQRKFGLECELRKQWSLEVSHNLFVQRRDL